MVHFLVSLMDKEYNEEGKAGCGLYTVVSVHGNLEKDRVKVERDAIIHWMTKNYISAAEMEVVLEDVIYNNPVWVAKDLNDEGKEYYIQVQHLPTWITK